MITRHTHTSSLASDSIGRAEPGRKRSNSGSNAQFQAFGLIDTIKGEFAMTLKSILRTIGANILGAVLAICLIAAGASAQPGPSIFTGKFTLPYEVNWGGTLLPPGTYFVTMESVHKAAIVRSTSEKTKNKFVFSIPAIGDAEKGTGTYLTIVYRGRERRVQALNLPELGKMLIYEPRTQAEREELAKAGQVQTLSVATAKK